MVKKLFALASVTALAGLVSAVGAAGCTETVVEDTPTDGGPKDKPDPKKKSPVGDDEDDEDPGDEGCYDEGSAAILNEQVTANFPGNRCTSEQVDSVIGGCFGTAATKETCEAAMESSPDCVECILGPQGDEAPETFDIPVFLPVGSGGNGIISVYACLSVALDKPECALPLTNQAFCLSNACSTCEDADETACREEAAGAACKLDIPKECSDAVAAVKDGDAIYKMCLGKDGNESLHLSAKTLCGTGANGDGGVKDAGADANL